MADTAAFHQLLSIVATGLSILEPHNAQHQCDAIAYQSLAIRAINQMIDYLTLANAISVIRIMVGFAAQANMTGNFEVYNIHMDAIIQVIGSFTDLSLELTPLDLQLILFWVDVTGCTRKDASPHFPVPEDTLCFFERENIAHKYNSEENFPKILSCLPLKSVSGLGQAAGLSSWRR